MNKYGAKKTVIHGIQFDSKKEAARYTQLKLLERAGEINDLELQPTYRIEINGVLVCKYVADFQYLDKKKSETIVEDVKSEATRKNRAYRIKNKLMHAVHGIKITEV